MFLEHLIMPPGMIRCLWKSPFILAVMQNDIYGLRTAPHRYATMPALLRHGNIPTSGRECSLENNWGMEFVAHNTQALLNFKRRVSDKYKKRLGGTGNPLNAD